MAKSYAEIIADEIHAAGWSYGDTSYFDAEKGCLMHVADAHKDGQRCISRAETLLTAYIELQDMIRKVEEDRGK